MTTPTSTTPAAPGRIQIEGKLYETASADQVSLADLMRLDLQLEEAGYPFRWIDLEETIEELGELKPDEVRRHPKRNMFSAFTVWATLRANGRDLTFDDAASIPLKDIIFLPPVAAPQDRQPGKRAAAKKAAPAKKAAAKKAATRQRSASARGA